jgi:hypothetical protein
VKNRPFMFARAGATDCGQPGCELCLRKFVNRLIYFAKLAVQPNSILGDVVKQYGKCIYSPIKDECDDRAR